MRIPQKMTNEQVREARELAASGESDESIARCYGVHPDYVRSLREGRVRKTAGGPLTRRSTKASAVARRMAGLERKVVKLEKRLARLEECLATCGGRID